MPTFITEALHLVSNLQMVRWLLLQNEQLIQHCLSLLFLMHMTHFVTKATPIKHTDIKCHAYKEINKQQTFPITSY